MAIIKPICGDYKKMTLLLSKRNKEILVNYAKYTNSDVNYVINYLLSEIINEDKDFVAWLDSLRYKTKIKKNIFGEKMGNGENNKEIG